MSRRFVASAFAAVLLDLAAVNHSWAQNQDQACVDVARIGLVDKKNIKTISDQIERIFLHSRSEGDSAFSDVNQLSLAAKVPVGDILAGGSGQWNEEKYQHIRQMDERTFRRYVHDRVANFYDQTTANKIVAEVVDKCLDREGFAAWPSFGPGDYQAPVLILSYIASRELERPPPLNVQLSYPPGISCTNDEAQATTVQLRSGNPVALRCTRIKDDASPAVVVANLDRSVRRLTDADVWFPPTAKQVLPCTKAVKDRIKVAVDKFQPGGWLQDIGPYCSPVFLTMSAKAEAKAQPGTMGARSSLFVYRGTTNTDPIFINDIKELRTYDWVGLGAGPRSLEVPAHRRETFLLQIEDRLADTEQGSWVIDIKPN